MDRESLAANVWSLADAAYSEDAAMLRFDISRITLLRGRVVVFLIGYELSTIYGIAECLPRLDQYCFFMSSPHGSCQALVLVR
jgi:hypothetical protein